MRPVDITNQRFGKLIAIEKSEEKLRNRTTWKCECDCGNYTLVTTSDLRTGNTESCGCGSSRNNIGERSMTHGMRNTRQYRTWTAMNSRCNNVDDESYGGKGIKVLWNSFEEFWEDMKETYSDDLTIDRIDYNGHYCKENCRWITKAEQARNKGDNNMVEYNGEILPLMTMCKKYNKNYKQIYYQWKYNNKTLEEAFNMKVRKMNKRNKVYTVDGRTGKLKDLCKYYNVTYDCVRKRIYDGMDPIEALTKNK